MPNLRVKKREFTLLLLFTLIVALLIFRIGWIQIVNGAELQKKATEQQTRDRIVSPKRGTILDTNGKGLAVSFSVDTISVIPKQITKPDEVAKKLSDILGIEYDEVYEKVTKHTSSIEVIKRKVYTDTTNIIRKWMEEEKIKGVKINEDTKRSYPYNNLACYVIGFTGDDNQGLDGIELTYEKVLKGLPGRIVSETDVNGKDMPFKQERFISPKDGMNVVLTIDETIQHITERYLQNAVMDNECLGGGVAIVMRPKTGEILAMAVKPDFNLNEPFQINDEEIKSRWSTLTKEQRGSQLQGMWRNRAISDTYEPGSTFKIITSVAGLEEGVVKAEENFVDKGYISIENVRMRCWRYYRPHGLETFKQAVQNSCNPVFIEVGQRLGKEKLYKYINAFGLREKTEIDLPGEAKGIFHDINKVGPIELGTISFGQRIQVTPIELINAASAIANGGKLMKPQIVKEFRDHEGNIVQRFQSKVVRQVISSDTSAVMRDIMESVVSEGTGSKAAVPGYRVAGKTGTADQGVNTNIYVASFIGFAPADDPEVSVLVVLNNPKGPNGHQGGAIAAPVVGQIMGDVLPYLKVERRFLPGEDVNKQVKVPEVRGKTLTEAKKILQQIGLEYRVNGQNTNGETLVVQQSPKPDVDITTTSQVILFTDIQKDIGKAIVPDLKGRSALESTRILKDLGLNIKITGMGEAVLQDPVPGTEVQLGTEVKVEFQLSEFD